MGAAISFSIADGETLEDAVKYPDDRNVRRSRSYGICNDTALHGRFSVHFMRIYFADLPT